MRDIQLTIPVELTAARIQRRASISAEAAHWLAIELHDIVAAYRQLFSVRPPCDGYAETEETDVVETMLRTAGDVWPSDQDAAEIEGIWLSEKFDAVDGDEPYVRYLRVVDKINGTDFAQLFDVNAN